MFTLVVIGLVVLLNRKSDAVVQAKPDRVIPEPAATETLGTAPRKNESEAPNANRDLQEKQELARREAEKLKIELIEQNELNAKELLKRARMTLLDGKLAETAVILKDLVARYPQSSVIDDAKNLLKEIEK